jgi:fatty acid CoA ligase FadD32
VLLTSAGAIPRTSSGKIGRRACRAAYLDGTLRSGKTANDFPDVTD